MASSWSVTFAIALTTTAGFCVRRLFTIVAARSIAIESCTEVPPNFITLIAACTSRAGRIWKTDHSLQVSPHFEQFSVEHGGPGSTADGIVREHGELPVENAARTQTSDGRSHAVSSV